MFFYSIPMVMGCFFNSWGIFLWNEKFAQNAPPPFFPKLCQRNAEEVKKEVKYCFVMLSMNHCKINFNTRYSFFAIKLDTKETDYVFAVKKIMELSPLKCMLNCAHLNGSPWAVRLLGI